jgi:aerobic carbon-monoxide dehydrogenase small subunit
MTARTIAFTLNGTPVTADIRPHHNLIEMLQSQFGLMGARESCGQGLCGCCTVSVNGVPVSGCLYLAAFADGAEVETIEGLGTARALSPVQQAFIEASAFQCGYCTPGMIMMVTKLLDEQPDPADDEIKDYLAGNLCRCACYGEILDAVRLAARMRRAGAKDSGIGLANDEARCGTSPPKTPPGVTATALTSGRD